MKKLGFLKYLLVLGIIFYKLQGDYGFNLSPSMEKGVYKKEQPINIQKGDILVLNIPENAKEYIHGRGYLPKYIDKLLKRVVAVEGDIIEFKEDKVFLNGNFLKGRKFKDSSGLPLPKLEGKFTLKENEYFVLGDAEDSFDSIYFGEIRKEIILNIAKKIEF